MDVVQVSLRDFVPADDGPLLKDWLQRPHVHKWWSMQQHEDLVRRLADSHAIILAENIPVGYVCWEVPPRHELEAAGLVDLPDGLFDLDILIGEPDYLGRGIGPMALLLLCEWLRQDGARYLGAAIPVDNTRSRRAAEKAGFEVFREFDDPESGRCVYLIHPL